MVTILLVGMVAVVVVLAVMVLATVMVVVMVVVVKLVAGACLGRAVAMCRRQHLQWRPGHDGDGIDGGTY